MDKELYKNLVYVVTIFSPALTTLVATLGSFFGWAFTNAIIVILGAITVFLGTLIGIYNPDGSKKNKGDEEENGDNQ